MRVSAEEEHAENVHANDELSNTYDASGARYCRTNGYYYTSSTIFKLHLYITINILHTCKHVLSLSAPQHNVHTLLQPVALSALVTPPLSPLETPGQGQAWGSGGVKEKGLQRVVVTVEA